MSRYIDADALEQHKFVSWTIPEFFEEKSHEQQAYQLGWNNAIEAIMENEPTADVKPVVMGEWILHQDSRTWECPVCGAFDVLWRNFCHNCGADMRGGEDDN